MPTRQSMTDRAFGDKLCSAYDTYEEHRAAGRLGDDAPGAHEIVNQLMRANREAREALEAAAGAPVGREIEGADEPPEFPGKPADPKGAADSALAEHRIRTSGAADIPGQLAAHRARQTDPARVANMSAHLQGYGRLR